MIEDDELLDIFVEEAVDLLAALNTSLQEWHKDLNNKEWLSALQRDLHTLKGGARMVQQASISELAHELEFLYQDMFKGNVHASKEIADFCLLTQAHLQGMMFALKNRQAIPSIQPFIEIIRSFLKKIEPKDTGKTETSERLGEANLEIVSEIIKKVNKDNEKTASLPRGVVRVKGEVAERINDLAGESAVLSINLEQELRSMRGQITDLNLDMGALNEQCRHLFREVESRENTSSYRFTSMSHDNVTEILEVEKYAESQLIVRRLEGSLSRLRASSKALWEVSESMVEIISNQRPIFREMKDLLSHTQMVPFTTIMPRLKKIVQNVSAELNKEVELVVVQAEGEMDRSVLERIIPPLEHLLRNGLDHGIEHPDAREAAGKPRVGTISLKAIRNGNKIHVEISDDGGGIDIEAVKRKAIQKGLLEPGDTPSELEILRYILEPNFSTKEVVTEISGRGVGMDVVYNEVKKLNGSLDINSVRKKGTTFLLKLPLTVALNRAVMVKIHDSMYGIPVTHIQAIAKISPSLLKYYLGKNSPRFLYKDDAFHLRYLGALVHGAAEPLCTKKHFYPVVLLKGFQSKIALIVDALHGSREVLVRSLNPQLSDMSIFFGATVLGDGRVVMLIDPMALEIKVKENLLHQEEKLIPAPGFVTCLLRTVLVVDDSLTVRKATEDLLSRSGYQVVLAADGREAIERISIQVPDLVITDLEMPQMDGIGLTDYIRKKMNLLKLPIIMITSRAGDKFQNKALEVGVNQFMPKPYQDATLLTTIAELIEKNGS